jgi:hypothetical protein
MDAQKVPGWRKSSRSGYNGNCVEFAQLGNAIAVRDSKNPTGPALLFTPTEWKHFIDAAKQGKFD